MKKLLSVILIISILVSLCSCSLFESGTPKGLENEVNFVADRFDTCYYTLTDSQKQLYEILYSCAEEMPDGFVELCENYSGADRDINVAYTAMLYDNPQFFWMPITYVTINTTSVFSDVLSVAFKYSSDDENKNDYLIKKSQRDKMRKELEEKVEEILASAPESDDGFEQQLYFNDYLCRNIEYNSESEFNNTVYGALVEGQALCEGYAKSFKLLCNLSDILCELTVGTGEEELHMWNAVATGDHYAYTDVTWNDAGDEPLHIYFNVTEEFLLEDHSLDPVFTEISDYNLNEGDLFNFTIRDCYYDGNGYYARGGYLLGAEYTNTFVEGINKAISEGRTSQGFMLEEGLATEFEKRKNGFILELQTKLETVKIEKFSYDRKILTLYFKVKENDLESQTESTQSKE